MLGIGAAWYEREHLGLGVPFPPVSERFERLEETLQICLQMWSDDDGPYEGEHYQLAETICSPPPIQQPRPPILIGGSGERKTLRLVAQYGDACNLFASGPAEVAHKLEVLAAPLRGREPRLRRPSRRRSSAGSTPLDDVDGFLRSMEEYAKLGIDLVELGPAGPDPAAWTAEVTQQLVPALRDL